MIGVVIYNYTLMSNSDTQLLIIALQFLAKHPKIVCSSKMKSYCKLFFSFLLSLHTVYKILE